LRDSHPELFSLPSISGLFALKGYDKVFPEVEALLSRPYRPIRTFETVDLKNDTNLYDQQDAFYVPYAGFKNVLRPRPNFSVFLKKENATW